VIDLLISHVPRCGTRNGPSRVGHSQDDQHAGRTFRLLDRGLLRAGSAADVVIIDMDRLEDVSTVEDPVHYVRGVDHVLVNGVAVVENGNTLESFPVCG